MGAVSQLRSRSCPHGDVRTGGSSTGAPQECEALTDLVPEPGQEPEDRSGAGCVGRSALHCLRRRPSLVPRARALVVRG